MSAAAIALSTLLQQCAPNVGERTMTAIVRVESKGYPLAMYDNTTGRSFAPASMQEALSTARLLIDAGHSVDLGIAQIDDANLIRLGLDTHTVFDACANLEAAGQILLEDYSAAALRYGVGQVALRHAIGMYNTGHLEAGGSYIRRVLLAANVSWPAVQRRPKQVTGREAEGSQVMVRCVVRSGRGRALRTRPISAARAPIMVWRPSALL